MKFSYPIVFILLLLTACSSSIEKQADALTWLGNNKNEYAFASNRFGETANAKAFVQSLYELGCESVVVINIMDEEWRINDEGGPYADTLIVTLPSDETLRKKIFSIHATESLKEGLPATQDEGQSILTFWWD